MTQYLGFPHYGDEYKVMGLAPYGAPNQLDKMRRIVKLKGDGSFEIDLSFFKHHKEGVAYQWSDGNPVVGDLFSDKLEALLGPRRGKADELTQYHRDLARSVQAMYEEAFFHLLDADKKKTTRAGNALVEADGTFTLSTYTANDGAPQGEYLVTVVWPDPPRDARGRPGPNRLPERYAQPETSGLRARVADGPNEFTFELKR